MPAMYMHILSAMKNCERHKKSNPGIICNSAGKNKPIGMKWHQDATKESSL